MSGLTAAVAVDIGAIYLLTFWVSYVWDIRWVVCNHVGVAWQ